MSDISVESSHKGGLNFSSVMIIRREGLQDLVQSLASEGPKSVDWSEVVYLFEYMRNPMMIGFHVERMNLSSFRFNFLPNTVYFVNE